MGLPLFPPHQNYQCKSHLHKYMFIYYYICRCPETIVGMLLEILFSPGWAVRTSCQTGRGASGQEARLSAKLSAWQNPPHLQGLVNSENRNWLPWQQGEEASFAPAHHRLCGLASLRGLEVYVQIYLYGFLLHLSRAPQFSWLSQHSLVAFILWRKC